jgi:hypothetical protein
MVLGSVLVFALLVGGSLAVAATHITEPTTIAVLEVGKGGIYVDNGKAGFSGGDMLTINHRLFTPDGETRLGDVKGFCIVASPLKGKEVWECSATARFAEGNVMVAGSFPPPEASPAWAVTGGTGRYENARGTMTFSGSDPDTVLTFSLIP